MLAITHPKQPSKQQVLIPNILPCKITHSGPIPTPKRHWNPRPSQTTSSSSSTSPNEKESKQQTAYFRGRKLLGTTLSLPEGYEGKVLLKTKELLPQAPRALHIPVPGDGNEDDEDEEAEDELPQEVKRAEEQAIFNEVVVWGHESYPEEGDAYIQGLGEWVGWAERVCISHHLFLPGRWLGCVLLGKGELTGVCCRYMGLICLIQQQQLR